MFPKSMKATFHKFSKLGTHNVQDWCISNFSSKAKVIQLDGVAEKEKEKQQNYLPDNPWKILL